MEACFIRLDVAFHGSTKFTNPFDYVPDEITLLAVNDLQRYLRFQDNFGLETRTGKQMGKMFGVLVVQNENGEVGYLRGFSGKLMNSNHHATFVPPVYDSLAQGGFLSEGMLMISELGTQIKASSHNQVLVDALKVKRKELSHLLQSQLFDEYNFLNARKQRKNVRQVFEDFGRPKLPVGAGECALPKLLQFAFSNDLIPLRMAEFWWGISPKTNNRVHGEFYPSCDEKCRPILSYMLA